MFNFNRSTLDWFNDVPNVAAAARSAAVVGEDLSASPCQAFHPAHVVIPAEGAGRRHGAPPFQRSVGVPRWHDNQQYEFVASEVASSSLRAMRYGSSAGYLCEKAQGGYTKQCLN